MINDEGHLVHFARLEDGEWQRLFKCLDLSPEKKLFLAILEDAWRSFEENINAITNKRRIVCNEARCWFHDRSDNWMFSFENVCFILDLEPDPIRRQLKQLDDRALKQGIPEVRDGGSPAAIGRPAQ